MKPKFEIATDPHGGPWNRDEAGIKPNSLHKIVTRNLPGLHIFGTRGNGFHLAMKTLKLNEIPFVAYEYTRHTHHGKFRIAMLPKGSSVGHTLKHLENERMLIIKVSR